MSKREIKFRAWHKTEEKMCEVETLRPNNGAYMIGLIPEHDQLLFDGKLVVKNDGRGRFCDIAEFELMEYTGRIDKNGKQIFEGDVLRFKGGNKGLVVHDNLEVSLDGDDYSILCFCVKYGKWNTVIESTDEVIGNIYENPELLK